jgi:hypothetical protein
MLFPDMFGPDSKLNGADGERRVLLATKKSGENIELKQSTQPMPPTILNS